MHDAEDLFRALVGAASVAAITSTLLSMAFWIRVLLARLRVVRVLERYPVLLRGLFDTGMDPGLRTWCPAASVTMAMVMPLEGAANRRSAVVGVVARLASATAGCGRQEHSRDRRDRQLLGVERRCDLPSVLRRRSRPRLPSRPSADEPDGRSRRAAW